MPCVSTISTFVNLFGSSVLHALLQHPRQRANLLLTERLIWLSGSRCSSCTTRSRSSGYGIACSTLKVSDTLRAGGLGHDGIRGGRQGVGGSLRWESGHGTPSRLGKTSIRSGTVEGKEYCLARFSPTSPRQRKIALTRRGKEWEQSSGLAIAN